MDHPAGEEMSAGGEAAEEGGEVTATQPDLSTLGNFHATRGTIPLSDEMIATAKWFDGWKRSYLEWPKDLWGDPANGVPCQDPAKNAFHVLILARRMQHARRRWIGPPLKLYPSGKVEDGSHRLRAVQWLAARGVVIDVPVVMEGE